MIDLVEFLKARLDEDEAAARAACKGPWIVRDWNEDTQFTVFSQRDARGGVEHVADTELHGIKWRQNRDHIARHDPARVLREVEAKRRIIEWVELQQTPNSTIGDDYVVPLFALAATYADHPDYRERWES